MAKFNIGQTVQLNSGGPIMTVMSIFEDGMKGPMVMYYSAFKQKYPGSDVFYMCSWFEQPKNTLKQDVFPENTLILK